MKKNSYITSLAIIVPTNAFSSTQYTIYQQNAIITTLLFIFIFIIIYFFLIKPQIKKEKKHKELLENLKEKTEIITFGGILGIVKKLKNNFVLIEINNNNFVWVTKQSILKILPDTTIKNLNYDN